nr:hypothetical protein [uncultured Brevundimonas sp.]
MGQDARSEAAQEYRRLYRTKRWRDVRADQLSRHPLCAMCLPRVTAATVCNHVDKDAKQTEEGFFAGPFNSLCATHHDSTQQREERRGHIIGCDDDGVPLDPNHHWNR